MKRTALIMMAMMPIALWAQTDDFGIWAGATIEKKLSKKLSLGGELEFRSADNLKRVDRWSGGLSLDYKLTDWLKAGAGYTYLYDYHPESYTYQDDGDLNKRAMTYFGSRHRFNMSLTASKDLGKLNISLRERWQYTYRSEQADKRMDYQHRDLGYSYPVKGMAKHVWRNRLQFKYKASDLLRPYISGETYVANGFDKLRLSLGTELKLSKQSSLNMGYIYQKAYNDDDEDTGRKHIISIGYKYKF